MWFWVLSKYWLFSFERRTTARCALAVLLICTLAFPQCASSGVEKRRRVLHITSFHVCSMCSCALMPGNYDLSSVSLVVRAVLKHLNTHAARNTCDVSLQLLFAACLLRRATHDSKGAAVLMLLHSWFGLPFLQGLTLSACCSANAALSKQVCICCHALIQQRQC